MVLFFLHMHPEDFGPINVNVFQLEKESFHFPIVLISVEFV